MRYLIIMSLMLLVQSAVCFADGDCPTRPATEPEKAMFLSMHTAASAAVPSAPSKWLLNELTDPKAGGSVPDCPGGQTGSPVHYAFRFQYRYDSTAQIQAANEAAANALKGTPEQQARMAAFDKKHDDLIEARNQARKNGDRTAVERIREEIKTLNIERGKLQESIGQEFVAKVTTGGTAGKKPAGVPERKEAELTFFVNADRAWVPDTAVPLKVAGAQHAFWRTNDGGSLVILLGPWKPTAPTFRAAIAGAAVVTKPQSVMIEIRADRDMAEKLAREMRLDFLQAQLNQ